MQEEVPGASQACYRFRAISGYKLQVLGQCVISIDPALHTERSLGGVKIEITLLRYHPLCIDAFALPEHCCCDTRQRHAL